MLSFSTISKRVGRVATSRAVSTLTTRNIHQTTHLSSTLHPTQTFESQKISIKPSLPLLSATSLTQRKKSPLQIADTPYNDELVSEPLPDYGNFDEGYDDDNNYYTNDPNVIYREFDGDLFTDADHERAKYAYVYSNADIPTKLPPSDINDIPFDPFSMENQDYDIIISPEDLIDPNTDPNEKIIIPFQKPPELLEDEFLIKKARRKLAIGLLNELFLSLKSNPNLSPQKRQELASTLNYKAMRVETPESFGQGPPFPTPEQTLDEKVDSYKQIRFNVNTERFDVWVMSALKRKGLLKEQDSLIKYSLPYLLDYLNPQITTHLLHHRIIPENYAWCSNLLPVLFNFSTDKGARQDYQINLVREPVQNLVKYCIFIEKEKYKLIRTNESIQEMQTQFVRNVGQLTSQLWKFREASDDKWLHPKIRPIYDALRFSLVSAFEIEKVIEPILDVSKIYQLNLMLEMNNPHNGGLERAYNVAQEHALMLIAANRKATQLAKQLDEQLYDFEDFFDGILVTDLFHFAKQGGLRARREKLDDIIRKVQIPNPPILKTDSIKFVEEVSKELTTLTNIPNVHQTGLFSAPLVIIEHVQGDPNNPNPDRKNRIRPALPYMTPFERTLRYMRNEREVDSFLQQLKPILDEDLKKRQKVQVSVIKEDIKKNIQEEEKSKDIQQRALWGADAPPLENDPTKKKYMYTPFGDFVEKPSQKPARFMENLALINELDRTRESAERIYSLADEFDLAPYEPKNPFVHQLPGESNKSTNRGHSKKRRKTPYENKHYDPSFDLDDGDDDDDDVEDESAEEQKKRYNGGKKFSWHDLGVIGAYNDNDPDDDLYADDGSELSNTHAFPKSLAW